MSPPQGSPQGDDAWTAAQAFLVDYLRAPGPPERLLGRRLRLLDPARRRGAERLARGVLREFLAFEAILSACWRRAPDPPVKAALLLALAEFRQSAPEKHPAITHHTVERLRRDRRGGSARAGFANAVLRAVLRGGWLGRGETWWARESHPAWLVERWERAFGADAEALLAWNQRPAVAHVRVPDGRVPEGCVPSAWPGFCRIGEGAWPALQPLLDAGLAYVRDPMTQAAVDLVPLAAGATVLEACAAPGGKTVALLERMKHMGGGRIVAVDLPGARLERLRENLAPRRDAVVPVEVVGADFRAIAAKDGRRMGWPAAFSAVLLDTPCSNTGVLRRRPDAKIRLAAEGPAGLSAVVRLQAELLEAAARWVAPGGALVYATCSLEPEENELQVRAFLERHREFRQVSGGVSLPWACEHDGGGAFLLTRKNGAS